MNPSPKSPEKPNKKEPMKDPIIEMKRRVGESFKAFGDNFEKGVFPFLGTMSFLTGLLAPAAMFLGVMSKPQDRTFGDDLAKAVHAKKGKKESKDSKPAEKKDAKK